MKTLRLVSVLAPSPVWVLRPVARLLGVFPCYTSLRAAVFVPISCAAALGDSGESVGHSVICAMRGPYAVEVTAFFGAFPPNRRPVQLEVRSPEGGVQRNRGGREAFLACPGRVRR